MTYLHMTMVNLLMPSVSLPVKKKRVMIMAFECSRAIAMRVVTFLHVELDKLDCNNHKKLPQQSHTFKSTAPAQLKEYVL